VLRFIYILAWVCIVGLLLYYFWPHSVGTVTNFPSSGTDIVALGDSLVAGYGSSDSQGFVSILSKSVDQRIYNLGVDGDTTTDTLARLNQLDAYKPKVVILLVGGNDYLQRKDMGQAFKNLGTIIQNIQSRGAVVVLVGVRLDQLLGNFDKQYKALVDQYHVAYVPDALDGVIGNPKLMSDSVHPNDAGYKIVADRIEPVLKKMLGRDF